MFVSEASFTRTVNAFLIGQRPNDERMSRVGVVLMVKTFTRFKFNKTTRLRLALQTVMEGQRIPPTLA